ncbi:MAG: hypothetical protein A2X52_19090 [Candidatus Rokubacteria bacterium GWC2_70_16]|nr:MAG: hypothetical protein A2X52_19090 [Candidatus Rokubacteria bacterium GWC2_70_16]OGL19000.1 MAG: hypothetical protein A3K12_03135 [Candidatus Rokubacteria bacterium RIFCSPLOWO2_12_FULL_71_19]
MTDIEIAATLDCRGLTCPLPVIKLSRAIRTIETGAVLEMLATDPGSVPDLEAFQKQTGHTVIEQSQAEGVFRFLVKRMK